MIVFKYNKTGQAAYMAHLDTLRAIIRTLRRAQIPVCYSKGYNPHMNVYLSPSTPLGIPSVCEYCAADTDINCKDFFDAYNDCCIKGMECIKVFSTAKNPNIAANVTSALYNIKSFYLRDNADKILNDGLIVEVRRKGEIIKEDAGKYILDITPTADGANVHLKFGNMGNLRADSFLKALNLGGCAVLKSQMYCGQKTVDDFIADYVLSR